MKFFPTTSEGWSNLVLALTTILGVILAFANLKNSKPRGKKHRIKIFFERITRWGWATLILSLLIGYGTYRSQELATIEFNTEKTRIEIRAFNDSIQQFEGFESNTKDLRKTIGILEKQANSDSKRFDVILSNFGKQISGILNTQGQIEELHHPLFPINLEYTIELDISGMSSIDMDNMLNKPINTIFKILDTLTPDYKSEVIPPKFLIKRFSDGRPRIELKAFDPEDFPDYRQSPFGYLYGDIIGNLMPEIFVIFSKSAKDTNLDPYICDLSLNLASLGFFYGKTEVSFIYNGGTSILITIRTIDIDYIHIDRAFHSIEGVNNGMLYTYYQPNGFPGVKSNFKNLKISFGNSKRDAFNLKYSQEDIQTLKVRNQDLEVYVKSGKEVLSSPQFF